MTVALSSDQPTVSSCTASMRWYHCRAGSRVHAAPVSASAQAWTAMWFSFISPDTVFKLMGRTICVQ
jgi:hypothetical protein